MMGSMKFPSTAGIDGIRKKKIIATACIVNSLLYVSELTRSPRGVSNSTRIAVANAPPMKKNSVMVTKYNKPMRLWSLVSNHDFKP